MSDRADAQRATIRELYAKRSRGDLTEKRFQARLIDASVALARAVAEARLPPDERVVAESHVVHAHIKLAESVLAEPEQSTVSIFASDRRLVRVRGTMLPHRPVSCDEADGTVVDELCFDDIERIVETRQMRWSEALTGLVIMALAWLMRDWLQVTGPFLMLLGFAGILHGLLLPTRSLAIVAFASSPLPGFELYGLRKRNTRALIEVIRTGLAARRAADPAIGGVS